MVENIREFNKFANNLANRAREISLKYFRKKIKIKNKLNDGFDPVTYADTKIQKELNKLILENYPDHSIVGEEESFIKKGTFEWCIDPIDGTKSYIQGVPLWGTLISLSKNKKIILGLADIPSLDERYIGYDCIAYKISNGKKTMLNAKNTRSLSKAFLNTTSPYLFKNKKDQKSFENLSRHVKSTRLGGDCYSYCLLADGLVDVVVESGLNPWDIRALEPIIKNSGGTIRTWENKSIFNGGRIIAACNQDLFNKCRKILNKKKPSN
jgi:histidinol phosphatase-like enzyme (inositol monophosphatase family)